VNILDAITDDRVFGAAFRGPSWTAWRVFLKSLFALPLTEAELAIYRKHTGRTSPPNAPSKEAWLVIGRRGGKSFALATVAIFLACFKDWRPFLGPGEVGTVMIIAADRKQARVIMRYCLGLLEAVPMLKRQIEGTTRESIALKNRIVIEIHSASFRTTRGYSVCAALLDEVAFWPVDEGSAEPDTEIIAAIKPAMATVPGAMLLCASSPYARRGALWEAYRRHYGKDGDPVLCWCGSTLSMNASVPQSYIDQHMADDPARAAAEYGATFRTDIEAFASREAIAACIATGVYERGPLREHVYAAFVDPSGGSSDSMTLCIGHQEYTKQTTFVDALREVRPPFSPEAVVSEFARLLKSYNLDAVVGDRYGGEWPREQFSRFDIRFEPAAKPKSELYTDLLPMINSGRISLLDHPKLTSQLLGLERRTARGGKDTIDHAPGQHDDVANAVAGCAHLCTIKGTYDAGAIADALLGRTPRDPHGAEHWRRLRYSLYLHSGGQVRL
jgi:Terminase large subunit, T4likevirus-type, N-terminal